MPDQLQGGSIPPVPLVQLATEETRVKPVNARGSLVGAAIGGALAAVGAPLAAIPFPLPWLGPLLAAILVGVGTIIAAVNGAQLPPASPKDGK